MLVRDLLTSLGGVQRLNKNQSWSDFFFFGCFSVVNHGEVKRLQISWISSTLQWTNQHAVAIKLVTEGADDENGCV